MKYHLILNFEELLQKVFLIYYFVLC